MFCRALFCLVVAVFAFLDLAVAAEAVFKVNRGVGITVLSLNAPEGDIDLYLPDDIVPGDVLSSRFTVKPKGSSDKEKKKNQTALAKKYQLFIGDYNTPFESMNIQIQPTCLDGDPVPDVDVILAQPPNPEYPGEKTKSHVVLSQGGVVGGVPLCAARSGNIRVSADFPIQFTDGKVSKVLFRHVYKLHSHPLFNRVAEAAVPVANNGEAPQVIFGPFDGVMYLDDTELTVNGQQAELVAETSRSLFYKQMSYFGRAELVLTKSGIAKKAGVNFFKMTVDAKKLIPGFGKKGKVKVEVEGLQEIEENFMFSLQNENPEVGNLEKGDKVDIMVTPGDIRADGSYKYEDTFRFSTTGRTIISTRHDIAKNPIRNMR